MVAIGSIWVSAEISLPTIIILGLLRKRNVTISRTVLHLKIWFEFLEGGILGADHAGYLDFHGEVCASRERRLNILWNFTSEDLIRAFQRETCTHSFALSPPSDTNGKFWSGWKKWFWTDFTSLKIVIADSSIVIWVCNGLNRGLKCVQNNLDKL